MYDNEFRERLSKLRNFKNVSAREMSLDIGLNESYINNIESGKVLRVSIKVEVSSPISSRRSV